jgi:hypothetical protein
MFPPWLLSLVIHLNALILLGLWIGTGEIVTRVGEVEVGWSDGSGGELLTMLDSPAPEAETLLAAAELTPLVTSKSTTAAKPEIDLKLVSAATAISAGGKNSTGESAGSPGTTPGAARTSIYGLEGEGRKFVYVFDRSASMNSGFQLTYPGRAPEQYIFLEGARQELLASLAQLDKRHEFQLIFYNDRTKVFQGYRGMKHLIPATDRAKELASSFLYNLTAEGDTYHTSALVKALRLKPDVIFLLTDGEEKDDLSAKDLRDLTRQNGGRTAINVIQICREPRPDSTLVELAQKNRGKHTFLDIDQLYEAMQARSAGRRAGD